MAAARSPPQSAPAKSQFFLPIALNRKNALFAGSDEGGDNWAVIATLIENCKLSGINPQNWMTETLSRLANGHPANSAGELMPWTAVG